MARVSPETLEVPLPAVTLSCLAWGPPDGPLAVLLHGFPDTAWTWRHLGPVLAEQGWRVVAPHTRGYAPSGLPRDGDLHVAALMADAVGVHDALGGDDRAVLVGHDWGAITANALGAHPRSPYARVVAMAVPPLTAITRGGPLVLARQATMSWYTLFNQLPVLPERTFERLVRHLWAAWSPGYDAGEDLERVLASLREPAHRSAALGYYRAVTRPWQVEAAYRDWHRTWTGTPTVPALTLHGAQDGCLHPRIAERAGAVLVEGAGHFLQLERPAEVGRLVSSFLAG
ncbi:alpha/beta fold hydrolase [Nocardioides sp. zg-579]|uniref:Alpha/beta fold hydrolase n=1 Tax=Nocardioides marmotae TaxID=2663857 RepID=A0A6I3J9P7_9ACTN|nr:alpha/beta fold hydrolase [Gordonia jinghuaiqii]MTB94318.1 alpha/beta fold hydrolase [Nocardioides marmotae]QKE03374.1 alpha/beta fold hydrolase [Nocardioides marmotae]